MAIVELSKAQRGVGDIELRNASGERKWISGKAYSSSDSLPSGYVKYGVIYGFEKFGAAMLVAFTDSGSGCLWCTATDITLPSAVLNNTTSSWGRAINGTSGSYKCMNVARVKSLCKTGSTNTTPTLNPSNAYYQGGAGAAPNTEAVFLANAEAINKYGTYDAYIAQVRPLLKGGLSGPFAKRCGKANTKVLAESTAYSFDAAKYCNNYIVSGSGGKVGDWWLPDMYELAMMMADEHYDLHAPLSGVSSSASYWSSVAYSTSNAWYYHNYGMSNYDSFTYTWLRARPVTLSE